ncbi:MAG: diacylglycerol kinase family lipid kinase [Candidatus Aminicenantes bacterium]|nr:MAG: diacylglycerol kinase family lipid kinase [Candidatus Aminicenantes bacterium]
MEKVHVIVNPLSARGKTGQRWNTIKEIIKHYFNEYKYIFTERPKQATEIARDLLKDGFDLIIGVGGDGTLNEITNGYFQQDSQQAVNEEAALGIIPSGTGSDFVRHLKIPRDFKGSVEAIKNSGVKAIDVGKITFNFDSSEAERSSAYFINVADFGLGAEVSRNIAAVPSRKRGAFSYYLGLLSTIRTYKSKKVRVVIDDTEEISSRFLIGAVANGRIFGGGMIIAPEAEPDDGYFDLVLVENMGRFEVIKNSRLLYTGTLDKHPKVTIKRVRDIKVYPAAEDEDNTVNIEYDGEIGKSIPAEFRIIEKSVNFRI